MKKIIIMSSTRMDICFADIYKDYLLFESCFEWRERRKWLRFLDGPGRGKGRARDGPEGKEKEARLLAGAVDYHSPPPPVPVLRTLGAAATGTPDRLCLLSACLRERDDECVTSLDAAKHSLTNRTSTGIES